MLPRLLLAISVILCSACGFAVGVSTSTELAAALATSPNTVTLEADIDCSGWTTVDGFSGTLDGQGHKLLNLNAPLFGTITGDIAISNLVVKDASVTVAAETSGILLKSVTATNLAVENVTFTGSSLNVSVNKGNVAFVVGLFSVTGAASFKDCHVDNTCSFALGVNYHGGIAGNGTATGTDATISFTHCTMAATLSPGRSYGSSFGGIAGSLSAVGGGRTVADYAHLVMDGCTNYSGTASTWIGTNRSFGGLVHTAGCPKSDQMADAVIRNCANYGSFIDDGELTSGGTNSGGLLGGWSNGKLTMENCVNFGSISSTNSGDTRSAIGGLFGHISTPIHVEVSINNCANSGNITGWYAGGLVGTLSHNASYTGASILIQSCMSTGTITARKGGTLPGEAIGALTAGVLYPKIDINGGLYATSTIIGNYAEGASVSALSMASNAMLDNSDGLVDGTDLAMLNNYGNCDLWKQGHEYPILKILPDESAPDTVVATFVDGETVIKQRAIARGWYVLAPDAPVHEGSTFMGWEPSIFTNLTQDTTFVAQYSSGILMHTVLFVDWNGTTIDEQEVEHRGAAVAPADPVRANYLFIGWDKAFDNVTEDMTIDAQYVLEHIYVSTAADFATAVMSDPIPGVTVHLAADIELPSDWAALDFRATLDGAGHTIACPDGGIPLFDHLYGCASNFVVNAASEGVATTNTLENGTLFGTVANTLSGGTVCNVTVENLVIVAGENCKIGIIAGMMADGAAILRCVTADTCEIREKTNTNAGGIVGVVERTIGFAPHDGEGNDVQGSTLALVADCTNNASFVVYTASAVVSGGIVGNLDNMYNSRFCPSVHILRCVNNGPFSASVNTGAQGSSVGGIVGRRFSNYSGHAGVLYIVDCANNADIASPGTSGANLGGIVGYYYRGVETVMDRCVNRGAIGTNVAGDGTSAVTGNNVGGLLGYAEIYKNNLVVATNCANYGAVTAGMCAGGFVGGFDTNADHADTSLMFYNCANYGAVDGADEDALTGQIFAKFGTQVATLLSRRYGAVNCFFMTNNFYAVDSGSVIITNGLVTAVDEGYVPGEARKTLNLEAKENGYELWVLGKVGKGEDAFVAPELECFRKKSANPGFKVVFR